MIESKAITTSNDINPVRAKISLIWLAVCLVLLIAAAVLPYVYSLDGEFVLDDVPLIVNNQMVHSIDGIPSAFTHGFIGGIDTSSYYYRPLVTVSYTLNYAISGDDPAGYKSFSLFLHVLATLLVFSLARRIIPGYAGPLAAGFLFAVHPAHTEAVAWISARTDLLATVFGLAALIAFANYLSRDKRTWYAASIVLFVLAMLSKESVLVLPILAVALAMIKRPRRPIRQLTLEILPFVGVVVICLAVKRLVLGYSFSSIPFTAHFGDRLLPAPSFLLDYLRMLFLPGRAQPLWLPPTSIIPIWAAAGWIFLLAIFALPIVLHRRFAAVSFSLAWILISLILVLNIVPILGLRPSERFVYLPSVGVCLLFGIVCAWLIQRRRLAILIAAAVIAYCGVQTYLGAPIWTNEAVVAARMVEGNPKYYKARILAGIIYQSRSDIECAIREFKAASTLEPSNPEPHVKLTAIYREIGDQDAELHELEIISRGGGELGRAAERAIKQLKSE